MNFEGPAIESGDFLLSKVHLLPDVLQWGEVSQAGLDTVFDGYVVFVTKRWATPLGNVSARTMLLPVMWLQSWKLCRPPISSG